MKFKQSIGQIKIELQAEDYISLSENGYLAFVRDLHGNVFMPMDERVKLPIDELIITLANPYLSSMLDRGRDWIKYSDYLQQQKPKP